MQLFSYKTVILKEIKNAKSNCSVYTDDVQPGS